MHDVELLSKDLGRLLVIIDCLNDRVNMLGLRFALLKRKTLLWDWTDSQPSLVLTGEELDEMNRFNCLDSCTSPGSHF